jgi:hypothetical protein
VTPGLLLIARSLKITALKIRNRQSATGNPQSTIRNPQCLPPPTSNLYIDNTDPFQSNKFSKIIGFGIIFVINKLNNDSQAIKS